MLKFYVSLLLFGGLVFGMAQQANAAPEIIGAPKCKGCHKAKTGDQWKIWTESAHARAFETLASAASGKIAADRGISDPQQEEECLKCHTTRVFLGLDVPVSEKGKYADNEGVGCESCHGPGSDYKPGKIMRDPGAAKAAGLVMERTAEACSRCHNETSPTFKRSISNNAGLKLLIRWRKRNKPTLRRPIQECRMSLLLTHRQGMYFPAQTSC